MFLTKDICLYLLLPVLCLSQCTDNAADFRVLNHQTNGTTFSISNTNGSCYCPGGWVGKFSGDGSALTNLTSSPEIGSLRAAVEQLVGLVGNLTARLEAAEARLQQQQPAGTSAFVHADPTTAGVTSGALTTALQTSAIQTTAMQTTAVPTTAAATTSALGYSANRTFAATGGVQTWVVPSGVYTIKFDAQGAQGSRGTCSWSTSCQTPGWSAPGNGGRVQGYLPVTPGATLYVYVGTRPADGPNSGGAPPPTGGFNGGGSGGRAVNGGNYWNSGAGGGATDIRIGGQALTNRKVVAGGGGGCYNGLAGHGGGLIGGSVRHACNFIVEGGTQSAGGRNLGDNGAESGSFGQGGNGVGNADHLGGGGGGGYYGGAAGMDFQGPLSSPPCRGNMEGGAGGSSYTDPAAFDVVHTQGFTTSDGQLTIWF